jgi:hypothetical protein
MDSVTVVDRRARRLARVVTGLFCGTGLIFAAIGFRLGSGAVPPNPTTGFRTAATLAHPDLWYAVNAVTGCYLAWLGVALILAALVLHATVTPRKPAVAACSLAILLAVGGLAIAFVGTAMAS